MSSLVQLRLNGLQGQCSIVPHAAEFAGGVAKMNQHDQGVNYQGSTLGVPQSLVSLPRVFSLSFTSNTAHLEGVC